jgi:hypothetical protein
MSSGRWNEQVGPQARDCTQTYTVAENGQVLATFMPKEDETADGCEKHSETIHP